VYVATTRNGSPKCLWKLRTLLNLSFEDCLRSCSTPCGYCAISGVEINETCGIICADGPLGGTRAGIVNQVDVVGGPKESFEHQMSAVMYPRGAFVERDFERLWVWEAAGWVVAVAIGRSPCRMLPSSTHRLPDRWLSSFIVGFCCPGPPPRVAGSLANARGLSCADWCDATLGWLTPRILSARLPDKSLSRCVSNVSMPENTSSPPLLRALLYFLMNRLAWTGADGLISKRASP
jgi:hypothetical protein